MGQYSVVINSKEALCIWKILNSNKTAFPSPKHALEQIKLIKFEKVLVEVYKRNFLTVNVYILRLIGNTNLFHGGQNLKMILVDLNQLTSYAQLSLHGLTLKG